MVRRGDVAVVSKFQREGIRVGENKVRATIGMESFSRMEEES